MSLAIYVNVTQALRDGDAARAVKARIRARVAGHEITGIFRNPRVQGHPYRFIRVSYEQGTV